MRFTDLLWSLIFFGLRSPMWAFVEICLFWLVLLATVVAFFKARLAAGMLLIPYIAWVTFAAVLNFTIWQMNR